MRNLNIGVRLALVFGVILIASACMIVGAIYSLNESRNSLLETLKNADMKQDLVVEMKENLLSGAISVRNMGLQTDINAVQKDEAEAKNFVVNILPPKQNWKVWDSAISKNKVCRSFPRSIRK